MKKKKIIALITVCAIAAVSIAVVPTYAIYYDEIEFLATISARSFEIDSSQTDLIDISTSANKTFNYGFFTSSDIGNCNFYFSVDTTALADCTLTLSKRDNVTQKYSPVKQSSAGGFVDENSYAVGEKRLYLLEITPNTQDLKTTDVLAKFSSKESEIEIPKMPVPPNGGAFDKPISDLVFKDLINETQNGYRIIDLKFIPRTDTVNLVMFDVAPVDKNEPTNPQVEIVDSSKPLRESLTIVNKLNGVRGVDPSDESPSRVVDVILTVYLPTNPPIKNFEYHIDYIPKNDDFDLELTDIIAKNVYIECPMHVKDSEIEFSFSKVDKYSFSSVTVALEKGSVTIQASDKFPNAFELLDSFEIIFAKNNSSGFLTFEMESKIVTSSTALDYFVITSNGVDAEIIIE